VSFTASRNPLLWSLSQNDRSSMDQNAFDLCGIAAMGDIFSSGGGLSLMVTHSITHAWFVLIFSLISSAKELDCLWGQGQLVWSPFDSLVNVRPCPWFAYVGHPNCAQSIKMAAAGCSTARPTGHIELQYADLDLLAA
jgi:hypothetical protein